jgi:hypothetical protein
MNSECPLLQSALNHMNPDHTLTTNFLFHYYRTVISAASNVFPSIQVFELKIMRIFAFHHGVISGTNLLIFTLEATGGQFSLFPRAVQQG